MACTSLDCRVKAIARDVSTNSYALDEFAILPDSPPSLRIGIASYISANLVDINASGLGLSTSLPGKSKAIRLYDNCTIKSHSPAEHLRSARLG